MRHLQDRKKLLSFVIVGGGPTGVEVAAELYDMITEDMRRLYPALMGDVCIRVIELMDYVLSAYDRKLGEYTAQLFKRNGIELARPLSLCFAIVAWTTHACQVPPTSGSIAQARSRKRLPVGAGRACHAGCTRPGKQGSGHDSRFDVPRRQSRSVRWV